MEVPDSIVLQKEATNTTRSEEKHTLEKLTPEQLIGASERQEPENILYFCLKNEQGN